jgi:DNA-binding transcriptional ArsR family regulator
MPLQDTFEGPETETLTVALEPAQNGLHSLTLLAKTDHLSGLGDWVTRTAAALSPRELRRHRLVIIGFYHALVPDRRFPSFPAYVDHLATRDPRSLRDKMLGVYARLATRADGEPCCWDDASPPPPFDQAAILKDVDSYLGFLQEGFDAAHIEAELEAQAYSYVIDPPAMQDLIVDHLRKMWDEHLAAEWARVEPMLQDAARAFRQADLAGKHRREIAQWVTGHTLDDEKWDTIFDRAGQLILVPSAHIGPYLSWSWAGDTFWVLFGARLPKGVPFHAPDLSRTEIVVRLNALADDNRLRVLQLVSEGGELTSREIMSELGFSQSATSRHLKQLSATGYVTERRCNGAKCYRLDPERIQDTLSAVSSFLLST